VAPKLVHECGKRCVRARGGRRVHTSWRESRPAGPSYSGGRRGRRGAPQPARQPPPGAPPCPAFRLSGKA
jgi:hypothetical protein